MSAASAAGCLAAVAAKMGVQTGHLHSRVKIRVAVSAYSGSMAPDWQEQLDNPIKLAECAGLWPRWLGSQPMGFLPPGGSGLASLRNIKH